MRDAKHVNYIQLDNKIKIFEEKDVITLTSSQAYEKFEWSREYFSAKPTEGYFIWVKKSPALPINTNILICSQHVMQSTMNLVIIEEGIEAKIHNSCGAQRGNLYGKHIGNTKIVAKRDSKVEIKQFHIWGKEDEVESSLDLILKEGAEVSLNQKCHKISKKLKMINRNYLDERSSLSYGATVLAEQGVVEMYDDTYLNGKKANGISRVKMIVREDTQIKARSRIIANEAATGHVDCMGLLLNDNSSIVAIPELINNNKDSSLTHEASVGKISDEVLNYLRSRGLSEDQAIDLVITGFLGEEEEIVIDGKVVSSKVNM